MSADAELREAVAAEFGLDEPASRFLQGATVEELSESAIALGKMLKEQRRQEPAGGESPAPHADPISAALAAKAQRKRALTAVFTGRAQPRDAKGRFAGTGFDGGAREPASARRSPEAEHGQLIGQMAALHRTFCG